MAQPETISLQKLHNNDVDEWAEFAWHYRPAIFKASFARIGIL